ncbi:IFI44-like protein, partial [Mya arenaria]
MSPVCVSHNSRHSTLPPTKVQMAGKLIDSDMDQLEQWIGSGPKTFTLLYSITRDGCDPTTFHQKCDNQGPTVTVLYNPQGSIYGGYAGQSWNQSGNWIQDASAFLFQTRFSGNIKQMKFPNKKYAYSLNGNSSYGPTFGGGYDLQTFTKTVCQGSGYFALNGNMAQFGHSYDNQGITANGIHNGNLNVTELEMEKENHLLQNYLHNHGENLRKEIEALSPPEDSKVSEFRILLLGPVGSGKSSFCNTVTSVFRGRITQRSIVGDSIHSVTTSYKPFTVRTKKGGRLHFRLCDTPGLEDNQGLEAMETNFLLDGHMPEMYEFNPSLPLQVSDPDFIQNPKTEDKVHCLVILLTKVDLVDNDVSSEVSKSFVSTKIEEKVKKASKLLGLPENHVLPVKNYNREMMLDDDVNILALLALRQMAYFAEDYLENVQMTQSRT